MRTLDKNWVSYITGRAQTKAGMLRRWPVGIASGSARASLRWLRWDEKFGSPCLSSYHVLAPLTISRVCSTHCFCVYWACFSVHDRLAPTLSSLGGARRRWQAAARQQAGETKRKEKKSKKKRENRKKTRYKGISEQQQRHGQISLPV